MKKIPALLLCVGLLTGIFSFRKIHGTSSTTNNFFSAKKMMSVEQTITLTGLQLKPYIPPKTPGSSGDNDFGGHGPVVTARIELFVKDNACYMPVFI